MTVVASQRQDTRGVLPIAARVAELRHEIVLRANDYGVENVRLFGSVARGEETLGSDIDLLVDVRAGTSLLDLISLNEELETLLGVRVDLVPAAGLKRGVSQTALSEARAL